MLRRAGDLYRGLLRRDDLRRGGGGEGIVPVGHVFDGGRIASGGGQQTIGNRRVIVRPCNRVLVRVDDGFPVQHRELRLLFGSVVQEGELRRLDLGRDGLGGDGHGNRRCVHVYAGVVGGPVYLIIDGVNTCVSPGRNIGGEAGPIQRIDQEAHITHARRDQLLGLSVVGQRVDFRGIGGNRRVRPGDVRSHCVGVADGVFGRRVRVSHLNLGGIQRDRFPRAHARGFKGGGDAGRVDGHHVAVDCGDAGRGHGGTCRTVKGLISDHNGSRNRLGLGGEGPLAGDGQIVRVSWVGGRDGDLAHACNLHLAGGRVHGGGTCRNPSHRAAAGASAGGQRERITVDGGSGLALDHQRGLRRLPDGEGGGVGGGGGQIVVAACGVGDGNGVGALVCRSGVVTCPIVLRYRHDRLDLPLRELDSDCRHLHFAVILKAVGGQFNGDVGQRLALDGHGHGLHCEIVVVFISHNLVIDGIIPRFGDLGDGRVIPACCAVQRVQHFAAAGRAWDQELMGLAVVGDNSRGRGRSKHNIRLFDHKCHRTRHGVIAARLVDNVDHSGITTGVYVVRVADLIFVCADQFILVNDCNRGLFGVAVIGVADKRVPILVKQRDERGRHRLGGDGDLHLTHIGVAVVGVALHLIIYRVISGVGLGWDGFQIGVWIVLCQRIHHCTAGPRAWGHQLLVSGIEGKRVARRFRGGGDFGLLLLNLKRYCNRGVFKGVVAVGLRRDGHSGSTHIDIVAVRHCILTGRNHCGAVSFLQRDDRLLGGAVVDIGASAVGLHCQALAAQLNCGIHRLFGDLRLHALGGFAGIIGRLLNAVPDGIFARVGALREVDGVGAVLAQGVFHNYASRVYHRPGGNQGLLSAVVGRCRGNRRGCDLGDRLADGRLDGEAGVGNAVVLGILTGDICVRCNYGHGLIHPGIRTVKFAGQFGNDNLIPGQNALFHISVDRGGHFAVIVLILCRHDGGDGLLLCGEGQEGNRVLVVGQAGDRVRTGFGGFHRGLSVTDDGDQPAVLVHLRNGHTVNVYGLPSNKTITRASGGTQDKFVPVDKGVGLLGDGQRRLLLEGDLERNRNCGNVIVTARFVVNDNFCRLIRSTHVLIVFIGHAVLACRQNGISVLDCDRRLFPVAVILVFRLRQLHHGGDRLALNLYAGDLGGGNRVVVAGHRRGHLHRVPDLISSGIGAGGNCGVVETVFTFRKSDLQTVVHRHRFQRARSHQLLLRTVVNRLCGYRGQGNGADFADRQRDGLAGGRLVVRPLRECDHNVISTGVSGQAVCVGTAAPLRPVRIPELVVQIHTGGRLYIDGYRRQIVLFHRTAIIVQLYRGGLGSGIPFQNRPFQLVSGKFVVLFKGSVVCFTGNGNRNGKAGIAHSGLCFIRHGVIGVQGQRLCGPFRRYRDSSVFGLDRFVIGQNLQTVPIHRNGSFILAEAADSRAVLGKGVGTRFGILRCAERTLPAVGCGAGVGGVDFARMLCTGSHDNLSGPRYVRFRD